MAVNLPTLSLPDIQGNRVLDAFKSKFGTVTTAETAKAYKKWLAAQVRDIVFQFEAQRLDEVNNAAKRNQLEIFKADLPNPDDVV